MLAPMSGTVIVTGASRGIGRAIADSVGAQGRRVVNLDRAAPERMGAEEIHLTVDLVDAEATNEALVRARAYGPITGLVNNAAASLPQRIEEVGLAEFEETMGVNLRAAMQCTQAVLGSMKETGWGQIVSISSRATLGRERRTANAVAPGPIDTELFRLTNPTEAAEALIRSTPTGRLGTPDDIARAVSFFLDHANGFVTGQVLYVCGGLSVGRAAI